MVGSLPLGENFATDVIGEKQPLKKRKTEKVFFSEHVSGKSHNAENPTEGTLWGFLTSILSQNFKKN